MGYGSLVLVLLAAAAAGRSASWSGPGPFGVLLLGHGGARQWNAAVEGVRKSLDSKFPVEIAFGMADPGAIQRGLDKLDARKVKKVVVVPLFVSSRSEVMEQTRYVLGMRREPSREFVEAPHAHMGHVVVKRVRSKLPLVLTAALDDHPVVADILSDRARAMSRDPSKESVVLVGHGPLKEEDNAEWLAAMERLGGLLRRRGGFAAVRAATLRDDSPPSVRREADRILREMVGALSLRGKVLVIPHLISQGGIERHIPRSLEGLFYAWTGKTLLPDHRIARWVEERALEGAGRPDMRQYKDAGKALAPAERRRSAGRVP